MTKTIYTSNGLTLLQIRIRLNVDQNGFETFDLSVDHAKTESNSVVITVTSSHCVLDVLRMALTLYKIEGIISEDRKAAVIKGVRSALGYKS